MTPAARAVLAAAVRIRAATRRLQVRNLQLALFSLPLAAMLVPLADAEALRERGLLQRVLTGWNGWAATVVELEWVARVATAPHMNGRHTLSASHTRTTELQQPASAAVPCAQPVSTRRRSGA